jgi:diaminohydroxyphosphoribosylaminopyrimidine deaminase/5-amino-6-(5-phosphoribosylamino)uracil reductase
VGCVVVRGGRAVGEGWHRAWGGPHAEVGALAQAGSRARGATAYVNLEPCSHWGKTGPCAEALLKAGVRRVVAAHADPNPQVSGRGFRRLRRAGLRVEVGPLAAEAAHLNRAFLKVHRQGLPYVVWKTAQTLDGKIASRTGASRWITGPDARRFGHSLRAAADAVLVGGNTLRRDDPTLSSHGQGRDPLRLVVSRSLRLPLNAKAFRGDTPAWVLTGPTPSPAAAKRLEKRGVTILKCLMKDGIIDLRDAFNKIMKFGVNHILIEGGGETSFAAMAAGLVDEAYTFLAPSLLGGRTAPTSLEGSGWPTPARGPVLRGTKVTPVGRDWLVHGYLGRIPRAA